MMNYRSVNTRKGFTLIELIVVIVILGVLAATAMPRFIGLQNEARAAKVMALYGTINSAAELANARCELDLGIGVTPPATFNKCNATSSGGIIMGGVSIQMCYKYPSAMYSGIDKAANLFTTDAEQAASDYMLGYTNETGGQGCGSGMTKTQRIRLRAATNPNMCYVRYTSVANLGETPVITVETSGC